MDNIEIRHATRADFLELYGDKFTETCKAWSVFQNGELVCIAGVAITHPLMLAFSQVKPGVKAGRKLRWVVANDLWSRIKSLGYKRLYAVADYSIPGAPAFLERIGFTHIESSVRGEVFIWVS